MTEAEARMSGYASTDLIEFLEYLGTKGLLPVGTARARQVAARKMLDVLDDDEAADLRNLQIDQLTTRFANLRGKSYTPDSIQIYKGRLAKSLDEFFRYKADPVTFKVSDSKSDRPSPIKRLAKHDRGPSRTAKPNSTKPPSSTDLVAYPQPSVSRQTFAVPIPLPRGCVVTVSDLPIDLTEDEAIRIAAVVRALGGL